MMVANQLKWLLALLELLSYHALVPHRGGIIVKERRKHLDSLLHIPRPIQHTNLFLSSQTPTKSSNIPAENDEYEATPAELVWPDEFVDEDSGDDGVEWIPDRVKARAQRLENRRPLVVEETTEPSSSDNKQQEDQKQQQPSAEKVASPYTDEEEEVIASMGGKTMNRNRRREIGYLGDSTLREIATDYSVPVCYLADVVCMWGVMPPIQIDDVPLGDMVTGEQAFALLEAVNSLDIGALNDRYSNTNLRQLCFEYDIDLQDAFSMAMKEGWSLPFGVESVLRMEQEDELLRVLQHEGSKMTTEALEKDEEDYGEYRSY